ncbi:MAG: acyltransferase [Acidobacteriota bacterium]
MDEVRNPSIDILRAAAVLLVFCRHIGFPIASQVGWVGVDLFFVLSGFLVSGLLFHEYQASQSIRAGRFLIRRGFKIYPQFYLFLAGSFAVKVFFGEPPPASSVTAEALFVQNYAEGLWGHTWSLGVEEHFYLILAVAIAWLGRRGGANPFAVLPKAAASLFGLILGARVLTWLLQPQTSDYAHIFPSHLRMDSLLAGVILSYFHSFHPDGLKALVHRFRAWIQPASIALLAPIAFLDQSHPFVYTLGFSLTAWAFVLLLAPLVIPRKDALYTSLPARAMARLGQASYAFYLWHGLVLFTADRLQPRLLARGIEIPLLVQWAATFGLTLGVAFFTTWLVEIPFLRLRDRWFPSVSRKARAFSPGEMPATPETVGA